MTFSSLQFLKSGDVCILINFLSEKSIKFCFFVYVTPLRSSAVVHSTHPADRPSRVPPPVPLTVAGFDASTVDFKLLYFNLRQWPLVTANCLFEADSPRNNPARTLTPKVKVIREQFRGLHSIRGFTCYTESSSRLTDMGDTGSEGSKPSSANVNVIPPRCPCGFWGWVDFKKSIISCFHILSSSAND